jgi:hypothetical protein
VSTEMGFGNSAEVGIFLEVAFTAAEFRILLCSEYRGIPKKTLHGILKTIPVCDDAKCRR